MRPGNNAIQLIITIIIMMMIIITLNVGSVCVKFDEIYT